MQLEKGIDFPERDWEWDLFLENAMKLTSGEFLPASVQRHVSRLSHGIRNEGAFGCWRCHKKVANYLTRPWDIRCVRCKARNGRLA